MDLVKKSDPGTGVLHWLSISETLAQLWLDYNTYCMNMVDFRRILSRKCYSMRLRDRSKYSIIYVSFMNPVKEHNPIGIETYKIIAQIITQRHVQSINMLCHTTFLIHFKFPYRFLKVYLNTNFTTYLWIKMFSS